MSRKTEIAVIGAGLIGRAWAYVFARGGYTVRAWDRDKRTREGLSNEMATMVHDAGGDPAIAGRVRAVDTLDEALAGATLVQESGPELLEVKRDLFRRLDAIADSESILASSSSALLPSSFTVGLAGARRCLVAHPVNPPHLVPVVELCPSPDTDLAVIDVAESIYREVGQVPVRLSREIEGFVLNRLQAVLLAEALRLVREGVCTVEGLDDTVKHGLGRRWAFMGPLETISLNAPSGVADYLLRYGPTMGRLAEDGAGASAFNEEVGRMLEGAFPSAGGSDAIRDRTAWRDKELAALDAHLRNRL